jgi:nucleoside-diphosphate-sugar epimerase
MTREQPMSERPATARSADATGGDATACRVLITGAAGYLGSALRAALPAGPAIAHLCTDLVEGAGPAGTSVATHAGPDTTWIAGDIADPALQARLFAQPVHRVFHLAGVVSGAAEADFARGRRVNLEATLALLERCRLQADAGGPVVRFVYASSIAVFGRPLPDRIDDATEPRPSLSYGAHKRACEILIDDYTRRGLLDGRALRLSGVVVRPPLANGALSGFNSDLFREPLAGRDYTCPVGPDATLWLCSLARTIANLLRIADVPGEAIGPQRALTAPALAVSVAEVVEAIRRADPAAAARIGHAAAPDPALLAQFGRWPRACDFARARALGLSADAGLDAIVAQHLGDAREAAGRT